MPSLSDIRRRRNSVQNTRTITRAMKLVASAKLKRAQDAATAAQPYQQTLQRVLERVVAAAGDVQHPLLASPDNDQDVLVIFIGPDRGLCGGFNAQLMKNTAAEVTRLKAQGKTVRMNIHGRKGLGFFSHQDVEIVDSNINLSPPMFDGIARALTPELIAQFSRGEFGAAYVAYKAARAWVKADGSRAVPMHLRNAPTQLMKQLGHGEGYRYAHDEADGFSAGQTYFPDGMQPQRFYEPVDRGLEIKIAEKLARLRQGGNGQP